MTAGAGICVRGLVHADRELSSPTQADAPLSRHTGHMRRPITPAHHEWLDKELRAWRTDGLIDEATAQAITGSYDVVPAKRINLARLLLTIGAAFVGIGVIWLVAANLDQLSPMVRLACVFLLFAGALVGAETLAGRRSHQGSIPSPVVGGMRLVATLLLGGVIFQAAQSMQVPAFEPVLVGLWAIGAFLYAYLTHSVMPLIVGLATGVHWLIWATMDAAPSALGFVLIMCGAAILATALSQLHGKGLFATVWRETGAAVALVGLFAAAIPSLTAKDFAWTWSMGLILVAALLAAAAGAVRRRAGLLELGMVGLIALASVLLIFWDAGRDADNVDVASWAHAALAVAVYVGAALWVAYLGIVHDSPRLSVMATAALVVFTTFQSFSVFAQIIQGAWLFVVLGLVLAGSGYLFDKARRELASTTEGADS